MIITLLPKRLRQCKSLWVLAYPLWLYQWHWRFHFMGDWPQEKCCMCVWWNDEINPAIQDCMSRVMGIFHVCSFTTMNIFASTTLRSSTRRTFRRGTAAVAVKLQRASCWQQRCLRTTILYVPGTSVYRKTPCSTGGVLMSWILNVVYCRETVKNR